MPPVPMTCGFFPQELAGYIGGDVSFIKEDFELQLNKPLILDSVSLQPTRACGTLILEHWS